MRKHEHPEFAEDAIINVETHHEASDVNVRALLWFIALFVVFAAITHFALWLLFKFFVQLERGDVRGPLTAIARSADANVPAVPRLQPFPNKDTRGEVIPPTRSTPVIDMDDMHAAENLVLNNYGWVDRQKGIVHIPIGDAKKLALQRGVFGGPAAPPAAAPQPGGAR